MVVIKIKSPLKFCAFLAAVLLVVFGVSYAFDNIMRLFGVELGFFGKTDPFTQRGSVNFLVAGTDQMSLADLIIVAQYNFETGELNALQIPRDTRVETDRFDKKINSAMSLQGVEALKSEVTQLTGLEIDRYVVVGIRGFREIVDAIGGVEIDVPIRMFYTDPTPGHQLSIDLQRGVQRLDGRQAEGFIRFRKNNDGSGYPDGDLGRIRAQRQFYSAVVNQIMSVQGVLRLPALLEIVQENVRTDLSGDEMFRFLGLALRADIEDFNVMQIPGTDGYVGRISYFLHDEAETRRIIYEYFTPQTRRNERSSPENGESNVRINRSKNRTIRVEVVDATGAELYGTSIGETVAALLRDNAFNVQTVRIADPVEQTELIDRNRKQASAEILKILRNIAVRQEIRDINYDVTIVLGADFNH